jgi:hypothetical protein
VHDRTPLLFPVTGSMRLHPDRDKVYEVLAGIQLEPPQGRRISPAVNNVRTDSVDLLKPVADDADRALELALAT